MSCAGRSVLLPRARPNRHSGRDDAAEWRNSSRRAGWRRRFSPQIVGLETHPPPLTSARRRGPPTPIRSSATSDPPGKGARQAVVSGSTTPRDTEISQSVIDRISYFYEHENSNIHRAAHDLAARATDAWGAREDGALKGGGRRERMELRNIVPWQQLCGAVAPGSASRRSTLGAGDPQEYERLLGPRTRTSSPPQVSNALGAIVRHGACVWSMARTIRFPHIRWTCRRSISSSSPATRSSGRLESASSTASLMCARYPALAGRRRPDCRRHFREDDLSAAAEPLRSPAQAISPCSGPRRSDRLCRVIGREIIDRYDMNC